MESKTVNDKIICSGALFYAKSTNRILLLQKSRGKHLGTWGLVGGTTVDGESAWQGLQREVCEEIGSMPSTIKILPLEKFVSNDSVFVFQTYFCIVEHEFIPTLSSEHLAWGWFDIFSLPKPVHKALDLSLRNKIIQTKIQSIIDIIDSL